MKQENWRGMPYYDVFWRKRHLTLRGMKAIYTGYYTLVFWVLTLSIIILLDLHSFAERVSLGALVAYTFMLAFGTLAFYVMASLAGIWLSKRYSRFFMVYPLVGFVSVTIVTYSAEAVMSANFGGGLSFVHAAEKLPVNYILTLVLETMYITFVMPMASQQPESIRGKAGAVPGYANCETFVAAGKIFYCNKMLAASSQDHYVRIRTTDGEEMLRARLSDVIGQLSCQDGIQPHRSHWVARRAVVGIISKNGHKYLELTDKSHLPIARGRLVDVQTWLEK